MISHKAYTTNEEVGRGLWQAVQIRLQEISMEPYVTLKKELPSAVQTAARYGSEYLTKPRLGQGAFQALVLDSYSRRCAVSGERTLPALEAAHIKPYAISGPHEVRNGLLLRADIHNLFDTGYMTLTNNLTIEVSHRIREEFENGHDYYAFHGRRLTALPSDKIDYPSVQYIEWHNTNVYRG
jgi:putative restriction endonuclease